MTKRQAIEMMSEVVNKGNCLTQSEEQALIVLIESVEKTLKQQENQRERTAMLIKLGREAAKAAKE